MLYLSIYVVVGPVHRQSGSYSAAVDLNTSTELVKLSFETPYHSFAIATLFLIALCRF